MEVIELLFGEMFFVTAVVITAVVFGFLLVFLRVPEEKSQRVFKSRPSTIPPSVLEKIKAQQQAALIPENIAQLLTALSSMDDGKWTRISKAIEATWGTAEGEDYLSRLLVNDRPNRQGFPKYVNVILTQLAVEHPRIKSRDVWDETYLM